MSAKSPSGENPEVTAKAITVRRARTSDVAGIRGLLDTYVRDRILLDKATVTLYEDIQEFWVAERDDNAELVGFGALHVMWEDLAEVRTRREARAEGCRCRASVAGEVVADGPLAGCSPRFLSHLRSGLLRQARLRRDR